MASLMDLIMGRTGAAPTKMPITDSRIKSAGIRNLPMMADISQMYAGYTLPPQTSAPTPPPAPPAGDISQMYAGYTLPPQEPAAPPAPLPPIRPMGIGQPTVRQTFLDRLLGPSFQSNQQPVVIQQSGPTQSGMPLQPTINWGDVNQPADFFRADQAARQLGLLG
jgi:hypothetical protein